MFRKDKCPFLYLGKDMELFLRGHGVSFGGLPYGFVPTAKIIRVTGPTNTAIEEAEWALGYKKLLETLGDNDIYDNRRTN